MAYWDRGQQCLGKAHLDSLAVVGICRNSTLKHEKCNFESGNIPTVCPFRRLKENKIITQFQQNSISIPEAFQIQTRPPLDLNLQHVTLSILMPAR
jgi:hypothetical protein